MLDQTQLNLQTRSHMKAPRTLTRAPRRQRGIGMITLILYFVVGGAVVLGGLKLMPHYLEYFSVKKVIAAMSTGEEVKTGTVAEIRSSFDRRAVIDNIVAVKGVDLDITKENNDTVVSAAWQARIALLPGYTLLVDFAVSTADPK
jgi:hypothetical protein